jgi:hypothetical protein
MLVLRAMPICLRQARDGCCTFHHDHDTREIDMDINIDKLEATLADLKSTLKDGLIATDIWDRSTGLSLAGINPQPAAAALFTDVTNNLTNTLADSGFPGLRRYYLLELEGDNIAMVIVHGKDLLQGILLNAQKINLGILLSVALPKVLTAVEKARR